MSSYGHFRYGRRGCKAVAIGVTMEEYKAQDYVHHSRFGSNSF